MKKYKNISCHRDGTFFSNYVLTEQCYQTHMHASLHLGTFLKSRVNAVLQTAITSSQTLGLEVKNKRMRTWGSHLKIPRQKHLQ